MTLGFQFLGLVLVRPLNLSALKTGTDPGTPKPRNPRNLEPWNPLLGCKAELIKVYNYTVDCSGQVDAVNTSHQDLWSGRERNFHRECQRGAPVGWAKVVGNQVETPGSRVSSHEIYWDDIRDDIIHIYIFISYIYISYIYRLDR